MNGLQASENTVHGKVRWIVKPITLAEGYEGLLRITSYTQRGEVTRTYVIRVTDYGYRLESDAGEVYDIETDWGAGQWQCDCGHCVYRKMECKHSLAVRAAFKELEAA
jgi:hypothetical protein